MYSFKVFRRRGLFIIYAKEENKRLFLEGKLNLLDWDNNIMYVLIVHRDKLGAYINTQTHLIKMVIIHDSVRKKKPINLWHT